MSQNKRTRQRRHRNYQHVRQHSRQKLWLGISAGLIAIILLTVVAFTAFKGAFSLGGSSLAKNEENVSHTELILNDKGLIQKPAILPSRFYVDSGYSIPYPEDGIKGIYLSATGMGTPAIFEQNMKLLENSALNSVVIDVKSDWGSITTPLESDDPLVKKFLEQTFDVRELMPRFEKQGTYPIARITTFKDTYAAQEHPEWSFHDSNGNIWHDASGQTFLNPFNKDTWKYVTDVAKAAAQAGFKDIQFDYVRFPEGFESFGESLQYDMGDYAEYGKASIEARQMAITDFLNYAKKELEPFGVHVSADIFGYVTTTGSAPGIGQNYYKIANSVDAICAMIYPSHWNSGDFGLEAPDLDPYKVVHDYMDAELEQLKQVDHKPIVRPWLQAFTASYLGEGRYKAYGAQEIEEQIKALNEHGVHEYLLWNASNEYPTDANY